MKQNFDTILAEILKSEGGYVNHPRDPGGATNKGVTQRVYDDYRRLQGLPVQNVRGISQREVGAIFRNGYWDTVKADSLPSGVDYAVVDLAYNSGTNRAARFLQGVLGVDTDGKIGPKTLAAIKDPVAVVKALMAKRRAFLRDLDTFDTFGKGWMARCDRVEKEAVEMAG